MRTIIRLNGRWQVAESLAPDKAGVYTRTVPVPGLVGLAEPPFPGTHAGERPPPTPEQKGLPIADPLRDYFWYRREIDIPALGAATRLRIAKAQFGLRAWFNGYDLGEHLPCFSAAVFDVTPYIRVGRNEVVLRVGAHPCILPPDVPPGSDQEKTLWTPGIYDDVTLWFSDNPTVTSIQVAPDIHRACATVRATIRNNVSTAIVFQPRATVREAASARDAGQWEGAAITLGPGEGRTVECSVPIEKPHLWEPDDPFLYRLEFSTGGDAQDVRFGLREFRFDTPTRRAYLNDKLIFLRGSNITLHRFFEDPQCQDRPWDPQWVRRLLVEWPKSLGWNCFRFSIGPVPDFWLDLADEVGLIIENEFFMWVMRKTWSPDTVKAHVAGWMEDSWNHPSVGWWSLCNETWDPALDAMIGDLRKLDLSGRAWNNGYYLPQGTDDPVDDHHYIFHHEVPAKGMSSTLEQYKVSTGPKSTNSPHPTAHATVLNEYGWLWLHRDGTPCSLTWNTYAALLKPDATPADRIRLHAELLSHETRHFRAHRNYAGVLHFTFLTADHPNAFTGDLWRDVATLEMWPEYEEAFANAFQPVCVHLHYFQVGKKSGDSEFVPVMVINDDPHPVGGDLTVSIVDAEMRVFSQYQRPWHLPPGGQHTWFLHPAFPSAVGHYRVCVEATWGGGRNVRCSSRLEITPVQHGTAAMMASTTA